MKKLSLFILLLIVSMLPSMASAQQPLTLDSCLRLAQQHNCTIRVAQLDIDKAQAIRRQVLTKFFPQVSGSFMAYHSLHHMLGISASDISDPTIRDAFQLLLDRQNEADPDFGNEIGIMHHGFAAGATAVQPIFMGGRVVNAARYARLGEEAARLQAQATERDVLQEAEHTYYLLASLLQKQVTVASALSLLDSLDAVTRLAANAGIAESTDALRVSLKRNEMQAQKLQLANGIQLAQLLLASQMGIDCPTNGFLLPPTDSLYQAVITPSESPRPEHRLLQIAVLSERYKKRLTLGEALPQITLGGAYTYGNLLTNGNLFDLMRNQQPLYQHNGLLFLTATVPLSSWWEMHHRLRAHNISITQAQLQQADLTAKLSLQTREAESQLLEAQALLHSDSIALQMAQENYRRAALNYRAGTATLTEVLEAQTLLLQAQDALTDRHLALLLAQRRLASIAQ